MTPYWSDDAVTLYHGDCLGILRGITDSSIDAIVTDPPYGLEFMGREWDGANGFRRSLNANDAGRGNVFGRTSRTSPEYSVTSKATAGFMTGGTSPTNGRPSFLGGLNPKCRNCDRWQRGANPCDCEAPDFPNERLPRLHTFQAWCEAWSTECLRVLKPGGHLLAFGGTRTWHRLACAIEDAGFEVRDSIAWLYGSGFPKSLDVSKAIDKTAGHWRGRAGDMESGNGSMSGGNYERTEKGDPVTAAAAAGWGTALKPAHEPIVVARKPLIGTVAANFTTHGTGAVNIDACRVGGRWPTNVLIDDSQVGEIDRQSGDVAPGNMPAKRRGIGYGSNAKGTRGEALRLDGGGASRFFPTFRYAPKAPTIERPKDGEIAHPTVKPLDLMRWLVRLVTPPGGLVLDPFAGSGTTAEACVIEGFRCITIEREPTYLPLIVARLTKPIEPVLFGDGAA